LLLCRGDVGNSRLRVIHISMAGGAGYSMRKGRPIGEAYFRVQTLILKYSKLKFQRLPCAIPWNFSLIAEFLDIRSERRHHRPQMPGVAPPTVSGPPVNRFGDLMVAWSLDLAAPLRPFRVAENGRIPFEP